MTGVYGPTNGNVQHQSIGAIAAAQSNAEIGFTYLSPDALMSYCESRMRYLDTQVQAHFAQQQRSAGDSKAINFVIECMTPCLGGIGDGGTAAHDLVRAYQKAINDAGGDQTEVGRKLISLRDGFIATVGVDGGVALRAQMNDPSFWTESGPRADKGMVKNVSEQTMKGFVDSLNRLQQSVNDGAEMGMIKLQAIMSQRQSALQITTGLLQSFNEMLNKIAANIGR